MLDTRIHLVDVNGFTVPLTERWEGPELDDASQWPESIETDCINYEISDGLERAALEQAGHDAACDAWEHDQLPPVRGGAPEPYQPSAADWAEYGAMCDAAAARRFYDAGGSFGAWLDAEGGPRS